MRRSTVFLAVVLALPLAARAADPAPGAGSKAAVAPAVQEKLDALQKDVQALRDAAKSADVPEAQRRMVEQHADHIGQMVGMMQSGCCMGAGTQCPCGGDPAKCPMMQGKGCCGMCQGGACPMAGQGPGKGPGPRRRGQ